MKLLSLVAHELIPRVCVRNSVLDGYVVKCKKCGEPIAISWGEVVMPLPRFKRYRNEIARRIGLSGR